jgi:Ca-activated chloride channel family protein
MKTYCLKFAQLLALTALLYSCGGSGGKKTTSTEKTDESAQRDYAVKEEARPQTEAPNISPADVPNQPEPDPKSNTEQYAEAQENPFKLAQQEPLSTFSIDVDNASYSNIRRFITQGQRPPAGAVRIEEMINYFDYNYPNPIGAHPFSVYTEIAECPWNPQHQLLHIGLQGKKLDYKDVKPANLVLLIDASGSMADENKLPLLKKSLALLLDNLSAKDRVALVAYAGSAGLILPSTPANQKGKILSALDNLQAGGSTAGGQGIELAYQVAAANRIEDGNNRVILCTDGDFNVGVSSPDELVKLITEKRKQAIYVTICGFGMGNYKDQTMELISQHGNGNYFYIDNLQEAKKVFVTEMRANLFTIAKDVKLQLEFNPAQVKAYRLVGYENRVMRNEDFDDDTKDAGELGAGHSVTALYELIPAGSKEEVASIKSLKYQTQTSEITRTALQSNEVMSLKMRYKSINSNTSKLIEQSVMKSQKTLNQSSENFKFSAAVAGFGLLLRDSKYKNTLNYAQVLQLAKGSVGRDAEGHRQEFLELVKKAQDIQ